MTKYVKGILLASLTLAGVYYSYDAYYCGGNLLFPYKLTSTSPNGTYRIEIKEASRSSNEHGPFAEDYKIIFRWEKNRSMQLSYCDNAIIGWSDTGKYDGSVKHGPPFSIKCPHADWVAENVIRFGDKLQMQPDRLDSYIYNETAQVVSYLRVGGDCGFVALDPAWGKNCFTRHFA